MANVVLTGNWSGIGKMLGALPAEMSAAALVSLDAIAKYAAEKAKSHIDNQDIRWVSLHPTYKAGKLRAGHSGNIYERTGDLKSTIKNWTVNAAYQSFAGIPSGSVNSDGQDLSRIAKEMEYGVISKNLPARELWHPVFNEAAEWFKRNKAVQPNFVAWIALFRYL